MSDTWFYFLLGYQIISWGCIIFSLITASADTELHKEDAIDKIHFRQ